MIWLQIVELIVMMLILPVGAGLFLFHFFRKTSWFGVSREGGGLIRPATALIFGYIFVFALLELVGIPCVLVFVYGGYKILMLSFGIVVFAAGAFGILFAAGDAKDPETADLYASFSPKTFLREKIRHFKNASWEAKIFILAIFLLLMLQLFMCFRYSSNDVDDFYYNAQALSAQRFGTLYRIDADTGRSVPVDMRHGMALFPMWQAVLSSVTGIHLSVMAHRIVPLLLIPLSYLLLYEIAHLLFPEKEEGRLLFLLLMNVWRIFGHVSLYTSETFFYTRTWQGKSFAGNFIFPAILWVFLLVYKGREVRSTSPTEDGVGNSASLSAGGTGSCVPDPFGVVREHLTSSSEAKGKSSATPARTLGESKTVSQLEPSERVKGAEIVLTGPASGCPYILLSLLILASGAGSSLAVLLAMMMTVFLGILFFIARRNIRELINCFVCCIPGVLYILIYMVN